MTGTEEQQTPRKDMHMSRLVRRLGPFLTYISEWGESEAHDEWLLRRRKVTTLREAFVLLLKYYREWEESLLACRRPTGYRANSGRIAREWHLLVWEAMSLDDSAYQSMNSGEQHYQQAAAAALLRAKLAARDHLATEPNDPRTGRNYSASLVYRAIRKADPVFMKLHGHRRRPRKHRALKVAP